LRSEQRGNGGEFFNADGDGHGKLLRLARLLSAATLPGRAVPRGRPLSSD
jgi:hypothetical protein